MRKTTLFCAIALVIALAMPAYAEVQNVKVSGDITVRGLARDDYDLADSPGQGVSGGTLNKDDRNFYNTITRLKVDADLTDNVSTTVRLLNQRDWGIGTTPLATETPNNEIAIDLANVTLKELFYAPLTLTLGRQNLAFGNQLIVGNGLLRNTNGVLTALEYSADNGYDSIRATLDYNPWTIDLVTAKIGETSGGAAATPVSNDQDLYGINAGYKFNSYDAEAELYYFAKLDGAFATVITEGSSAVGAGTTRTGNRRTYEENEVHTVGTRGSAEFVDGLHTNAEFAYQFGEIRDTMTNAGDSIISGTSQTRDRRAWALNVGADYDIPVEAAYFKSPNLLVEYGYRSGEEASNNGKYEAWDAMYTGKFYSAIGSFLSTIYATTDIDDTPFTTNSHTIKVKGSFKPIDKLTAELAWVNFRFADAPVAGAKKEAGNEVDAQLTYNYTDDVTFGLLGGWFIPGDYYDRAIPAGVNSKSNDPASSLVGTVSVAF